MLLTLYNHDLSQKVRKIQAFIRKDFCIAITYKLQFTFQFCQVFFSIAIVCFIGKMFDGSGGSGLFDRYGTDHFSFALVGISINSYCRAGLVNITNDIRQSMTQGSFEPLCATPIHYAWLLVCSSLWPFMFETVRVAIYFLTAWLLFGMVLSNANWWAALIALTLTVPIFILLGVISSGILIVVKRGDPINWIFSSLSALLAGTMFPVEVLPTWLQKIAFCLPLTHALEALRKSLLVGAGLKEIKTHLAALVLFLLVLIPMTLLLIRLCLKRAKHQGAFSTH
jgi:ABC-2 type transport system permease protein